MKKLLLPGSALLWGLQLAFLSPALALILVNLYGATTADLGWVLGIYNAGGFLAALLIPARADKTKDYLVPMLVCGGLTILLAGVLSAVTALPMATVALVVLGGPAGVGSTLLFAHLRHSGGRPSDVINARAIVSVAWVAGPPLATFIIGSLGTRAILLAVAAIAVLNIITTALLIRQRTATSTNADTDPQTTPQSSGPGETPVGLRMGCTSYFRVRTPAGHKRHGHDNHDSLRSPNPGAGCHLGRHRPRSCRSTRDPGSTAMRPTKRTVFRARPDHHQLHRRDSLLFSIDAGY